MALNLCNSLDFLDLRWCKISSINNMSGKYSGPKPESYIQQHLCSTVDYGPEAGRSCGCALAPFFKFLLAGRWKKFIVKGFGQEVKNLQCQTRKHLRLAVRYTGAPQVWHLKQSR